MITTPDPPAAPGCNIVGSLPPPLPPPAPKFVVPGAPDKLLFAHAAPPPPDPPEPPTAPADPLTYTPPPPPPA